MKKIYFLFFLSFSIGYTAHSQNAKKCYTHEHELDQKRMVNNLAKQQIRQEAEAKIKQ
jgi:hypothetical protein